MKEKHPDACRAAELRDLEPPVPSKTVVPAEVYAFTPQQVEGFERKLVQKEPHNWSKARKPELYAVCLKHLANVHPNLNYGMSREQLAKLLEVSNLQFLSSVLDR